MSPNARERAYEKRRYEEWRARQAARAAKRARRRRISLSVAAAVAVVLVVSGVFLAVRDDDEPGTSAAGDPAATPTAPPASSAPPTPADDACPAPTVTPPAQPKTFASAPPASEAKDRTWAVTLRTTCGDVQLELDGKKAPQAVSAMLLLAREKFFDGSPCHRLTTAGIHVLQCGDPTGTGTGGPGFQYGPVENRPQNDVYPAGTVAMARAADPNSQGSQFFLVYEDSTIAPGDPHGYTVLGRVTSGLDVIKKVAEGGETSGSGDGAPKRAISIVGTTVTAG